MPLYRRESDHNNIYYSNFSEILSLRASLSSLSNELSSIKTLVASLSSRDNQPPIQNKPEAPAIISDDNTPQLQSNSVSHKLSNQPCKVSSIPIQDLHPIADRRYNVVLFGVEECSKEPQGLIA